MKWQYAGGFQHTMTSASLAKRPPFNILAVDGGGTRGIFPAQLLARVEDATGRRVRDCFDLLAGTSTGAIVVGAAAAGVPMENVVTLFERHSQEIFPRSRLPTLLVAAFRSRYSRTPLDRVLQRHLPASLLEEIATPLMITSADLGHGRCPCLQVPLSP